MPFKDPAMRTAYRLKHYKENREKYLERARKARNQPGHKEYMDPIRRKCLLARYGITHDDYLAMAKRQGGRCAICGSDNPGTKKSRYFDVDHDHKTGKVRALLCRNCNVTVGVVEGKAPLVRLIHAYLSLHVEFDPKETEKASEA